MNRKRGIICYLAEKEHPRDTEYNLEELILLCRNVDIEIVGVVKQSRFPDPGWFLGRGKLEELKMLVEELAPQVLVCSRELSPRQVKNLEEYFPEQEIWDRTQVILEIFGRRARSREGKIQVELARLTYLYPRMLGLGNILSRLGGGIGTRGPGETKLEVMRRVVRRRIQGLEKELKAIQSNRATLRKRRKRAGLPLVALVGYTNAGKSTLINALMLEDKKVEAKDELFATLDPVVRRVRLPSGKICLFSDTVGFVRDMPPRVKEAFRATLEELYEADLLLHVIDITSPYREEQEAAVERTLMEMELGSKKVIKVYNKIDIYREVIPRDGVPVSALTGENLELLLAQVEHALL